MPAATLIDSDGIFSVAPAEPNTPEQIEIRGIFLKGNQQVGVFSDAKAAFIAP